MVNSSIVFETFSLRLGFVVLLLVSITSESSHPFNDFGKTYEKRNILQNIFFSMSEMRYFDLNGHFFYLLELMRNFSSKK